MRRPSQLTQLIWDFYRENPKELEQLQPLTKCKVFRRWGVLHIQCSNREIAEAIATAQILLREPIAQMRLAQKIKISVKKMTVTVLDVKSEPSLHQKLR